MDGHMTRDFHCRAPMMRSGCVTVNDCVYHIKVIHPHQIPETQSIREGGFNASSSSELADLVRSSALANHAERIARASERTCSIFTLSAHSQRADCAIAEIQICAGVSTDKFSDPRIEIRHMS